MRKVLVAFAIWVVVATGLPTPGFASLIFKGLDFDVDGVLPSAEPDIDFVSSETESDLFSVSGGLLQQRTRGKLGGIGAQYAFPNGFLTGGLDASIGFIMEARFRIIESLGIGAFIDVHDGTNRYSAFFFPTGVQIGFPASPIFPIDDLSEFHTYTITSLGNDDTYEFLVDGVSLATRSAESTTLNGFQWGVGGFEGDVDWDFVHFGQMISVPEPSTLGLFLIGLLGSGLMAARRARRSGSA